MTAGPPDHGPARAQLRRTSGRRRAVRLLAAALVAWAVAGWGAAVWERARRPLRDPPQAALWHLRPDGPRVGQLRSFLAGMDAALPAPATIAVAMPVRANDPSERLFRYLWVAYLLPRHQVLPSDGAGAARMQYWASYRGAGTPPAGAVEIARWPEGALYRLKPAASRQPGAAAEVGQP